jgi:hypothetical protein
MGKDMRGQRPSGDYYEILGEEALLGEKDCILLSVILFWFGSLGGLLQGCTKLLGVLGLGAWNPHGILELGSWTGSVPSWQGGKIQFWVEFGQSSGEDNQRLGN